MKERIHWMDTKLQFDTTTLPPVEAVEPVECTSAPKAEKILRDGQLLILRNGKVYTPSGNIVE